MAEVAIQAPEAPERVNSFGRIFGALFSPKATFESIARRPTWLAPIIVLSVLSLGVIGLFGNRVGWRAFFAKQMEGNSRVQQMSPEQQQQALEMQLRFAPPFVYAVGAVSSAVIAVVIAAVLLGMFNGLAGANLNFKTSLAIVAYGLSPRIIVGLLGILVLLLKDPSTVDLQNLVASNATVLLSDGAAKWLVALFRSIDIFIFWPMFLMAIGYHRAAPKKLSTIGALAWLLVVYSVIVIVVVGLTAAFS
jgi:Yip1-like protein